MNLEILFVALIVTLLAGAVIRAFLFIAVVLILAFIITVCSSQHAEAFQPVHNPDGSAWDCTKAKLYIEVATCNSPVLAALHDKQINQYSDALSSSQGQQYPILLKNLAISMWNSAADTCKDDQCVAAFYEQSTDILLSIAKDQRQLKGIKVELDLPVPEDYTAPPTETVTHDGVISAPKPAKLLNPSHIFIDPKFKGDAAMTGICTALMNYAQRVEDARLHGVDRAQVMDHIPAETQDMSLRSSLRSVAETIYSSSWGTPADAAKGIGFQCTSIFKDRK
jgi:uncharacterized protein